MMQSLYGVWLGDVFFCFSGETSEPRVDAWTHVVRRLNFGDGGRLFQPAALRLAELRWPNPMRNAAEAKSTKRRQLLGRTLEGLAISPKDTFKLLLHWDDSILKAAGIQAGEEIRYWIKAAQFTQELLLRGEIAPSAEFAAKTGARRRTGQETLTGVWRPRLSQEADVERFRELAEAMPPIGLSAPGAYASSEPESREEAGAAVLFSFMSGMIHAVVTGELEGMDSELSRYRTPFRRGSSPAAELWWNSLISMFRPVTVQGPTEEMAELIETLREAGGTGMPVIGSEETAPAEGELKLVLRLEPPLGEHETLWGITFWVDSAQEAGLRLPARTIWAHPDRDLDRGKVRYVSAAEQLLMALGQASELAPELEIALLQPRPEGIKLEQQSFFEFLTHAVPRLQKAGITVLMPSRWSRAGRRRAGLRLQMLNRGTERAPGAPNALGMEQLVAFKAEPMLDGKPVTAEELAALAEASVPYVMFRGEWIEVDTKEIRQVLRYMKKEEEQYMPLSEWLHLAAEEGEDAAWKGLSVFGAESEGLLSFLLDGQVLRSIEPRQVPAELHGELRPYQERGYQWLSAMRELGFGVCLADDMGLGKTIQVITCLLDQKHEEQQAAAEEARENEMYDSVDPSEAGEIVPAEAVNLPALIVCPTSLLGNWQRELKRFAPNLSLYIHHGGQRLHGTAFQAEAQAHDIVLTTYHLAGRDGPDLASLHWSTVVLDEAQYIKNYRTKQAQSVMRLSAPHRIAMTGTPVENRLSELWSIFQFLNPGYLGTASSFRQRYTGMGTSEENSTSLRELHRLVSPFMLRRLKSDPDIRKDLPEKLELKSYCSLTPEQTILYQRVVDDLMGGLDGRNGIARKGIVLSSLTKLKQICDHPVLADSSRKDHAKVEASGKMERLLELVDAIRDNGESALIFTQYVAMGELLVSRLTQRYEEEPYFLHGGVSKAQRDEMVETFQKGEGPSLFVLSLRAGGVGLNLTRASHVIHYDRWWNPAVENQATDRVFRIGQNRNVQVHKLICQGTLEERIDELIESKKALSEQVVGSGENWLTEMSDDELRGLISLQGETWL
ncbi:DEAD/DEAH box helicase [Paenibacillus illinoisensis]|uniref:Superfamily II DNA-RNA helicase n=1 Tax=Paenibacillus illinoisensis TaxID=59845 RepID=A0A2W0CD08_9BACL|nr:DEAD/DEAH box helicase [Paenibacillus illinoisensis]PYY30576.1 Superfamily II DNA-RNA helicase [Paenibacillus illinoisensis]